MDIVDVCGVLTDQPDYQKACKYWNKLKHAKATFGITPSEHINLAAVSFGRDEESFGLVYIYRCRKGE